MIDARRAESPLKLRGAELRAARDVAAWKINEPPLAAFDVDEAHEPVRSARARDDPERDLGKAEDRGLVGDPEIGRESELEPPAENPSSAEATM